MLTPTLSWFALFRRTDVPREYSDVRNPQTDCFWRLTRLQHATLWAIYLFAFFSKGSLALDNPTSTIDPGETRLLKTLQFTPEIAGEDRLIAVPENRLSAESRQISVHYLRIPAQLDAGLPPVIILPGGPGQSILAKDVARRIGSKRYSLYSEIAVYNAVRDVLIINQRGLSGTLGRPTLPQYWEAQAPNVDQPFSFEESATRLSLGLQKTLNRCEEQGFDLRGYQLGQLVDDIEAIRVAHRYDQLAFRAASFGSQLALAYLSRYPERVERLLLSGVEPVDYGYDDPQGIWSVIERVEAQAKNSEKVERSAASGQGKAMLGKAIQTIVQRLEQTPVQVRVLHPRTKQPTDVWIGADDFRRFLLYPSADSQPHSRKMLGYWPKFISEIHSEDYRYLASQILKTRRPKQVGHLLLALVDNSISISPEREANLRARPAFRWLGDINWRSTGTRSVCPSAPFAADLRKMVRSPVPLLMVHGTLDLATPLENALDLLQYFPNGTLMKISGGTHAATYHAASVDPNFLSYLAKFMNASAPARAAAQLPREISLPPIEFASTDSPSLAETFARDTLAEPAEPHSP